MTNIPTSNTTPDMGSNTSAEQTNRTQKSSSSTSQATPLVQPDFRFRSLRALKKDDASRMIEWMHQPDTSQYFQKGFNHFELEDVLAFIDSSLASTDCIHLAVTNSNDTYLGTISLKNIEPGFCGEYAISMHGDARGTGAAKTATLDLLAFAFEELDLYRAFLNVRADNARAISFYEKIGFTYEGKSRAGLKTDEGYLDLLWYSMLKPDFDRVTFGLQ